MPYGATLDRMRGRLLDGARPPGPGRILDLPSAKVHVQVRGGGPQNVVYIPDPPNGLDTADPLLRRLEAEHRVVACELPGFGWSRAKRGHSLGIWDHAATLQEVLEATETERPILIAPCITGFVALAYARAHPERVSGLVLPQVPDWDHAQRWADRVDRRHLLRRPWLGQLVTAVAEDAIALRWYGVAEPEAARRASYVATFKERERAGRLFSVASGLQGLSVSDPLTDAPPLEMPTLLLWGERDPSHAAGHAHTLAPAFKHAHSETVAAGHFPDLTRSGTVVDWVRTVAVRSAD